MRSIATAALVALLAAGCGRQAVVEGAGGPTLSPAAAPATANYLPAGTVMQVRLTQPIGTAHSQTGDRFTATVEVPIVATNGQTVVPQGTVVSGTVLAVAPSAGAAQPAVVRLGFDEITVHGQRRPFAANILETEVQVNGDGGQTPRTGEHAVAGAAAGAVLGTILRGGVRGAVTGAAVGAGVGTVISLGTERADANLPIGTRMTIQSTQHVQIH
jgi:hypothetical protein